MRKPVFEVRPGQTKSCTAIEDGYKRLEISDLGGREVVLSM